MGTLRPEEEWVRRVVARALHATVVQHDDGSVERMYDLAVIRAGRKVAAAEVTSTADGDSIALWKLLNPPGRRWVERSLVGGWQVDVLPGARGRRIRRDLPELLRALEAQGVSEVRVGDSWHPPEGVELVARELGITSMRQAETSFPGSIYCLLDLPSERCGGFVADQSNALAEWIGPYLQLERADVCEKLERSELDRRHAIVILPSFSVTDFSITDTLMAADAPLPDSDPCLPDAITDVWAMSTWTAGRGMRWSPTQGWKYFDKLAAV